MATRTEQVLQRVHAVLMGATTAGSSVHRGMADALGLDDLPGIVVRRKATSLEPLGNGVDVISVDFDVDLEVRGTNWETTADALHEQVDELLQQDAQLAELLAGLVCISTQADSESGDGTAGRITATYRGRFKQRRG